MLTKSEIKQIKDLQRSRCRAEQGLFVCEGPKLSGDMLGAYPCRLLVATKANYCQVLDKIKTLPLHLCPQRTELVDESFDFTRLSGLKSPQALVAVFELPQGEGEVAMPTGLSLLLDDVQDPGNVGTLIRTADWFGLECIYLTPACADPFSPKVLQATMGAMSHVRVVRLSDTEQFLRRYEGEVLATFLEGESLYELEPRSESDARLLVLGNEGKGISPLVTEYITKRITIPPYKQSSKGSDSLNVAIAGAVCLGELRRNQL